MLMSQRNMMFISLLVLFLALTIIHAQNECSGESANCINIRNCPQVISIVTDPRPLSAQMLQTLRNAQCGFEGNDPKYCCNQITTTTTTTVEPEIETDPPDVTNHPNLRLLDHRACGPIPQQRVTTTTATDPEIKTDPPDVTNHQNLHLLGSQSHGPQTYSGNETDIFQYPWMAIIVWIYGPPICSGTIISSRYVLTSASCSQPLYIRDFREMSVRIGDHDTSKHCDYIKDNKGADLVCVQIFDIDTIHSHPKYNRTTMRNDIGLIRLNDTVDFRPRNVKPICLPFGTAATLDRSKAIVTGWGLLLVECCWKLLQTKVSLVTNERCENFKVGFYPNVEKFNYIWYKHLCAEIPLDVNPCLADHGGPLQAAGIYNGRSVRIIQHGVNLASAFIKRSLCPQRSVIYTRVSYYMNWILDTMTD